MDLGVAVSSPKGLMVPVVKDADKMGLAQIELEISRLAKKAREGKLQVDEMTGGTFTITNGGVFGSMLSTPIFKPTPKRYFGNAQYSAKSSCYRWKNRNSGYYVSRLEL